MKKLLHHIHNRWFPNSFYFPITISLMLIINYWAQDKIATILQKAFSNTFHWKRIIAFWMEFHWNVLNKVLLMASQHWLKWWLGAVRQHTITWTNIDQFPSCHRVSLGRNELTHLPLDKMDAILQAIFSDAFHEWKVLYFHSNFIEVCS